MKELAATPMATIGAIYQTFLWPISDSHRAWLGKEDEKAKRYRSGHQYAGDALGISSEEISARFDKPIRYFGFSSL